MIHRSMVRASWPLILLRKGVSALILLNGISGVAATTDFSVRQEHDLAGHVTREVISGPNYYEFTSDPRATGEHEVWEVAQPESGILVRTSVPLEGHYSRLEIEKTREGGKLSLTFLYQPQIDQYELSGTRWTVDHRQFAESLIYDLKNSSGKFIPSCSDDAGVYKAANEWVDVIYNLENGNADNGRQLMECYLTRYQNALFANSCTQGPFAKSLDDLKAGMLDVLMSADQTPGQASGQGKYLQCLTGQGFSVHTSRIEAQMNELLQGLPDLAKADAEFKAAKADPAKLAALCKTPLPNISISGRSAKPIACDLDDSTEEMAEYDTGSRQIVFHRSSEQLQTQLNNKSSVLATEFGSLPTKNVYGSYFFHELLHSSDIDNETVVYALQNCCDGRPGDHSGDCTKAQKIAADVSMGERYNSTFAQAFPAFSALNAEIATTFGTDNAKNMMNAYYSGFDSHKATAEKAYDKCVADHKTGNNTCTQSCEDECSKLYFETMAKFSQDFFNDPKYCAYYLKTAQRKGDGKGVSCGDIGKRLSDMMLTSKTAEASREKVQALVGNPTRYSINGVLPGPTVTQGLANDANKPAPPKGDISGAASGSSRANSPPAVRLGEPSAARPDVAARTNRGTVLTTQAGHLARQVSDAVFGSPANAETSYASSASSPFSTEFGAGPRIRIPGNLDLSRATVPDLSSLSGASLRITSSPPSPNASSSSRPDTPTSANASSRGSTGKNHEVVARARGGANPDRPGERGLASAGPITSAQKPNGHDGDGIDFSTGDKLRSLITGPYDRVLTVMKHHQTDFVRALIDEKIEIVDASQNILGLQKSSEIYLYCAKTQRLTAPGQCR